MNEDRLERYVQAKKVSLKTLILNAILFVLKFIASFVSGSHAMLAESIHTFADVGLTIVVLIGMKLSLKTDDKEHPYGHERIESEFAKLLAIVLFLTAIGIGYNGLTILLSGTYSIPGISAVIVVIISILAKEFMYRYTVKTAENINSAALKADAWHQRTDALSSIGTLIGIASARMGITFLDPVAALIVSLMIIKVAIGIYISAFNQMIDKTAGDDVIISINELTSLIDGVLRIDDIKTRLHGSKIYTDIEISVDPDITVMEGHSIAENVHISVETIPKIKHCMVHVNPYKYEDLGN